MAAQTRSKNRRTALSNPRGLAKKQGLMQGETLLFVRQDKKSLPQASCLFIPKNILYLRRIGDKHDFKPGKDYILAPDSRTLTLPRGSSIPFLDKDKFYAPAGTRGYIPHRWHKPSVSLLNNKKLFHNAQVEIGYEYDGPGWDGYVPEFAGKVLPRTIRRLRRGEPVLISILGDSISAGYDSTQATGMTPGSKGYAWLLAERLSRAYTGKVRVDNQAVGGWTARQGLQYAFKAANAKPNLAIIAFGMNDVSYRNPGRYGVYIAKMIEILRKDNPRVEFILVASMLANPEWKIGNPKMFEQYRDELVKLCGPGIALADMTQLWKDILKRKKWLDLTGNGVNHPNDFGHRLYADTIGGLLIR